MAAQVQFAPVSNREDWKDQVSVYANNQLVDLTGAVIVMAVTDPKTKRQMLLAQTADGTITVVGLGIMQFRFPVSLMRNLEEKQYEVGATAVINGETQQLFKAEVPIYDGGVP